MAKQIPEQAHVELVCEEADVQAYLRAHNLEHGYESLVGALIQYGEKGAARANPCALLIIDIDGKKHLVKTTLRMLLMVSQALDAAAKREHGEHWRGP